jgi:hypothetical protein
MVVVEVLPLLELVVEQSGVVDEDAFELAVELFAVDPGRVGRAARCQPGLVLFRSASLRTGQTRFRVSGSPVTTA